jgi:hypothetical protein
MRRGSVPEIIEDGVTGFVVDNEEEALAAIGRLGTIDRRRVRKEFERRFSARRMANDYLQLYKMLAQDSCVDNGARVPIRSIVLPRQRRREGVSADDGLPSRNMPQPDRAPSEPDVGEAV